MAAPIHQRVNIGTLPDVLLAGIFDYSSLPEVAACAAASVELRNALKRLSPALERRLILRRFPILATIRADAAEEPSPRELFLSQKRLFANDRPGFALHSRSLEQYVFSVELELKLYRYHGTRWESWTSTRESLFVGTGKVVDGPPFTSATLQFNISEGVFDRTFRIPSETERRPAEGRQLQSRVILRVMASKGFSRACLGQECASHYDRSNRPAIMFDDVDTGWRHGEAQAADWLLQAQRNNEAPFAPEAQASWKPSQHDTSGESMVLVHFKWAHLNGYEDMTKDEFAQALERYATWTS